MKNKILLLAVTSLLLIGCSTGRKGSGKNSSSSSSGGDQEGSIHYNQERVITEQEKGNKITTEQASSIFDDMTAYNQESLRYDNCDYLTWKSSSYMDEDHHLNNFQYAKNEQYSASFQESFENKKVNDTLTYPNHSVFSDSFYKSEDNYIRAFYEDVDGYYENDEQELEYNKRTRKQYYYYTQDGQKEFNVVAESFFNAYASLFSEIIKTLEENYFNSYLSTLLTVSSSGDGCLYVCVDGGFNSSVVEYLFLDYHLVYYYTMVDFSFVGGVEELGYSIMTQEISFGFDSFNIQYPDLSDYELIS